jgi:hypothetical protein
MSALSLATLGIQCQSNKSLSMATLGIFCPSLAGITKVLRVVNFSKVFPLLRKPRFNILKRLI